MAAAEDDLHAPLDHSGRGLRADGINSTTSNLESAVGFVASLGIVTMEEMGKEEHSSEKLTNQASANPNRVTPSHFLESAEARLRAESPRKNEHRCGSIVLSSGITLDPMRSSTDAADQMIDPQPVRLHPSRMFSFPNPVPQDSASRNATAVPLCGTAGALIQATVHHFV